MDLSDIDTPNQHEAGAELELMYSGAPTGWHIGVRGTHSRTVKLWLLRDANDFRAKQWAARQASGGKEPAKDGVEQLTEEELDFKLRSAAMRIYSMRGVKMNGEPFEYSRENAEFLVRRHPPWADEILDFSADMGNFSKAQPTT